MPECQRIFYRVPGTPGRGSGIGLSLVACIASLHSATLEVSQGLDGRGLGITLCLGRGGSSPTAAPPPPSQASSMPPTIRPSTNV